MKSLIGLYDSHDKAIACIRLLKENGFTNKHLSLLGKVDGDDEVAENIKNANTAVTGLGIGAVAGSAIGVLTGVGLLAIPGLGFLVGAGALAGAVAGFDFGVIHDGMGYFYLNPAPNEIFTAVWNDENNMEHATSLPAYQAVADYLKNKNK